MQLPTIKVKAPGGGPGFVLINESDFDSKKHEKYSETDAKKDAKAQAKEPPQATEKPGFKLEDVVRKDTAEKLVAAGFGTAIAINAATLEQLDAVDGVGERVAEQLKTEAAKFVEEPPAP